MSQKKTPIDFDIDRYLRASKRLDLSDVDWDDIPNHHLSDGDVMCMHYMMDIETHAVIYLRDLYRAQAKARLEVAPRRGATARPLGVRELLDPGGRVKTDEEVDALALYLFGDSDEGREAARGIDAVVSEMPGLEGGTLLEDAIGEATERAAREPGCAGTAELPTLPRAAPGVARTAAAT